jgi:hypothetical protein
MYINTRFWPKDAPLGQQELGQGGPQHFLLNEDIDATLAPHGKAKAQHTPALTPAAFIQVRPLTCAGSED